MRFERAAINGDGRRVNSGLCPSDRLAAAVAFLFEPGWPKGVPTCVASSLPA
jgi:hypothetical protein